MRIVIAHNRYKYAGGEDSVMHAETKMLRTAGHDVELFEADNLTISGPLATIAAAGSVFHSPSSARRLTDLMRHFRPDVLHIHNWFPLLSPSIIPAARAEGVAVVHTLHNFRMLCVSGMMYRDGHICHDCLGKRLPIDGVLHGCYSESRLGSAIVTAAFGFHRLARTWDDVSIFIALSQYQRALLIRGGLDASRIVVKPNFVHDAGRVGDGAGRSALFAGRLTAEKGIRTVLKAWSEHRISMPLRIFGDGPLAEEVRSACASLRNVQYVGHRPSSEIEEAMANARILICASESHEAFGLTIVEAFARGTPVLAAATESIAELVEDRKTGLLFRPGDAADLAAKAALFLPDCPAYLRMRRQCREAFEQRFTERTNYELLMGIYASAIAAAHASRPDVLTQHVQHPV
jgi:glycosyltransferase involved in cell wall biosynthesis